MKPRLRGAHYLFIHLAPGKRLPENLVALATFEEDEGTTAIVEEGRAQRAELEGIGPFAMITLEVQSDLQAVGFVAAVARSLADAGIPANAVAAYNHDHLFVPADRADAALRILEMLSAAVAGQQPQRTSGEQPQTPNTGPGPESP